jgi:small conductance mechanosensitive channel
MESGITQAMQLLQTYGVPLVWKLLGAVAIWIIGGWIIAAARDLIKRSMSLREVDTTLARYIDTSVGVLLKILLVIAILGTLGIATTSFAAILAAAGVAIGMAWSGLLANFAAGVFLILLRPFKVGDAISAGGASGEVKEIGMFATTIHTGDNVRVIVGNNKIYADNIVNYSANAYRGVDLRCQIAHGVDPNDAISRLKARVSQIANIEKKPEPIIEILEFNASGTLLLVKPFCHNSHHGRVLFDTNKAIQEVCSAASYPVPATHQASHQA